MKMRLEHNSTATKKQLELMREIMCTLDQTAAWEAAQRNDPQIQAAYERLNAVMERVKPHIPHELFEELEDAAAGYGFCGDMAAMLYGLQVAETLRAVAVDPSTFTKYMRECDRERE